MAAANPKSSTEMPETAQQVREKLVSAVQQGHRLSLDAAQTWVKAVSVLPVSELPKAPSFPAVPGVEATTRYAFDVATDLLTAQREFALQLADVLTPERTTSEKSTQKSA